MSQAKTDHAIRFNVMAEVMGEVNKVDPRALPLIERQPGEERIGAVTELAVRMLGYYLHLLDRSREYQRLLEDERRENRQDVINVIDRLEDEATFALYYFVRQLRAEPELREWKRAPIFLIRQEIREGVPGWCAVVAASDLASYQRHVKHRPYKAGDTETLYRRFAVLSAGQTMD